MEKVAVNNNNNNNNNKLQLSCHSVAVQTKQVRKHTHKRNSTKTHYKQYNTQ
jgi:hypothetical protein